MRGRTGWRRWLGIATLGLAPLACADLTAQQPPPQKSTVPNSQHALDEAMQQAQQQAIDQAILMDQLIQQQAIMANQAALQQMMDANAAAMMAQ